MHGSPVRRPPGVGRPTPASVAPASGEPQQQPLTGIAVGKQHRQQRHRGRHAEQAVAAQSAARAEDESEGHSQSCDDPQGAVQTEAQGQRSLDGWTG